MIADMIEIAVIFSGWAFALYLLGDRIEESLTPSRRRTAPAPVVISPTSAFWKKTARTYPRTTTPPPSRRSN